MRGISPYAWIQSLPLTSDCKDSSVLQVLSSSNTDQCLPFLFPPHYAFPLFPTLWNAMKAKKITSVTICRQNSAPAVPNGCSRAAASSVK